MQYIVYLPLWLYRSVHYQACDNALKIVGNHQANLYIE